MEAHFARGGRGWGFQYDKEGDARGNFSELFGVKKVFVVALFSLKRWELSRYLLGHCAETKYDRKHFRSRQNLAIFNISDEDRIPTPSNGSPPLPPQGSSCVSRGYNLVPCIKGIRISFLLGAITYFLLSKPINLFFHRPGAQLPMTASTISTKPASFENEYWRTPQW